MRADDHRFGLAAEAYVFGYPLVSNVRLIGLFAAEGIGLLAPAGFNAFAHVRDLPGPRSAFVGINAGVLHSLAQVDLAPGPLVLSVPDSGDRYSLLLFVDAWRNNFAYAGRRTGAGRGGSYVLVPPGWTEPTPPDLIRLEAPTRLLTVIGRFGLDDPADARPVHRLQDELRLRSLDPDARRAEGPPEHSKSVCDDLRFWEELRIWLRACPPPPAEADYARRFAPLGIFDDPSPYVDPDPALTWSLRGGLRAGRDGLERVAQAGRALSNGWSSTPHALDFNLDRLGPGTRDESAWRMTDRDQARLARAMAARQPIGATHGYESIEATCLVDVEGRRLTGAHRYVLDLAPPPPAAEWSVTMYDAPDYYLVDNPLHRYSLGSRTRDLRRGPDGSVRVLIQSDPPSDEAEQANWLPAATGDFRPTLRIHSPGEDVLDGTYAPPPIRRVH
ncbi:MULTISPECIES: DUF1254 domain-containing protein [Frankia]|uniref:DUF1254 domain-containing protein n=1 Tax=Frankia alni (strain DSM 45986 / CECT 9034 / ACN14a) TaxID=326424 RepID=Q0RPN8_FRAAA|nr:MULTISPECIES: DUF1254 domain-containing protein [Frankia]CAJ60493.1 hypothetical protein FRAAL1842 [Frankia alni ACN14a]